MSFPILNPHRKQIVHCTPGKARTAGVLAGLVLLAGAPSAMAQVAVDQSNGVAAPCGTAAFAPCALLSDGIAAAVAGDTITVEDGIYAEYNLLIDFDLTIEAAPGAIPVIDAGGADRHFVIAGTLAYPLTSVALRGLTLQNGYQQSANGGGILATWVDDLTLRDMTFIDNIASDGGAIAATAANVMITGSEFRDNLATAFGGAIFYNSLGSGTTLSIIGSVFAENQAVEGGAVFQWNGDLQSIENSFHSNTAGSSATFTTGRGGAIKSEAGNVLVRRSAFANNSAEFVGTGGAIDVLNGDIEIVNSTFFENESPEGAALQIWSPAAAVIRFSTFADNLAPGGIGDPATITNHGSAEIHGSIIARSALGRDCDGVGSFTGIYNRIDGACFGVSGELTPVTGLAATPARNGGPTRTLMLDVTSNAVDVVPTVQPPFVLISCPPFDQRRSLRPAPGGSSACDIGAVEAF